MSALFDASLLGSFASKPIQCNLPNASFVLRPLHRTDFDKGVLQCLEQLSVVGPLAQRDFEETFDYWKSSGVYFVVVVEETVTGQIVGSGTLLVERKLLHHNGIRLPLTLGYAGHIEDIVTHSSVRGNNLGKVLIEVLRHIAKEKACYKGVCSLLTG
ncbi:hypothetical protein HDU91_003677 [Kappamyces sp. JEL0680]|nr:hypothetical protein HDU91_003677 [Kappamyces sp. JEL0680]